EHAPRRETVERGHGRHMDRGDARAADGDPGPEAEPARLPRGQGQHGVAVREQHLAVGDPDRVVAELLGVIEEADLVHVRHRADGKTYGLYLYSSLTRARRVSTPEYRRTGSIARAHPARRRCAKITRALALGPTSASTPAGA